MRAMARTEDGDRRSLIELKAVDARLPALRRGRPVAGPEPRRRARRRDGSFGAAVDPAILDRLGLTIGDSIKIGDAVLQLRATIEREPDAATGGLDLRAAGPDLRRGARRNRADPARRAGHIIITGCGFLPGSTRRPGPRRREPPFPRPAGRSAPLARPRRRCSD